MKFPIALHVFLWLGSVLMLMGIAFLGSQLLIAAALMGVL